MKDAARGPPSPRTLGRGARPTQCPCPLPTRSTTHHEPQPPSAATRHALARGQARPGSPSRPSLRRPPPIRAPREHARAYSRAGRGCGSAGGGCSAQTGALWTKPAPWRHCDQSTNCTEVGARAPRTGGPTSGTLVSRTSQRMRVRFCMQQVGADLGQERPPSWARRSDASSASTASSRRCGGAAPSSASANKWTGTLSVRSQSHFLPSTHGAAARLPWWTPRRGAAPARRVGLLLREGHRAAAGRPGSLGGRRAGGVGGGRWVHAASAAAPGGAHWTDSSRKQSS